MKRGLVIAVLLLIVGLIFVGGIFVVGNNGGVTGFSVFDDIREGLFGVEEESVMMAPCPEGYTENISQYGITWYFDGCYQYGTFVNGDYWVKVDDVTGVVNVTRITPDYFNGRHGWMVNPRQYHIDDGKDGEDIFYNGYDNRDPWGTYIEPSQLPYLASSNESIIKAISWSPANAVCEIPGSYSCLETAAVLTILAEIPPSNGANVFRPPFFDVEKPFYTCDNVVQKISELGFLDPEGISNIVSLQQVSNRWARVQLDHAHGAAGRRMHPIQNMFSTSNPSDASDYGSEMSNDANVAVLRFFLNVSDDRLEDTPNALINYVQAGIDLYSISQEINWYEGAGQNHGRALPIIFAAYALDNQEMKNYISTAEERKFQERGQMDRNLFGIPIWGDDSTSVTEENYWYEMIHPGTGNKCKPDVYEYIDGGYNPPRGYQRCCTSMQYKGTTLSLLLIPKLREIWNQDNIIEYTYRWVEHGALTQPDPCAPVTGFCVGGSNNGLTCSFDNLIDDESCSYSYTDCSGSTKIMSIPCSTDCPEGYCGVGRCDGGQYSGELCTTNYGGPSCYANCGYAVCSGGFCSDGQNKGRACTSDLNCAFECGYNENYRVTYGPDPLNYGMCILDEDLLYYNSPTDFACKPGEQCGRFPNKEGFSANDGGYMNSFSEIMWDKFSDYAIGNPIIDLSANPVSGYKPLVVQFDASGSIDSDGSIVSYEWDFGDGTNGFGVAVSHTYITYGEYIARLDITGNDGKTASATQLILVGDPAYFFEDFERMTDVSVKATPSGLSFNLVSGNLASIGTIGTSKVMKLNSPTAETTTNFVITKEGENGWNNFTMNAKIAQYYTLAGGVVLNYKDSQNYYLLNLRTGKLEKVFNGEKTIIDGTGQDISLPWGPAGEVHNYTIISQVSNSIKYELSKDGIYNRTFTDSSPFSDKGNIGFYDITDSSYHYFFVDDIKIILPEGSQTQCVLTSARWEIG